jgi:hypothetical protein
MTYYGVYFELPNHFFLSFRLIIALHRFEMPFNAEP